MTDRIQWNAQGDNDIDEIVVNRVDHVHIEQMNDRCWWIGIFRGDAYWMGNFACDSRGRMTFTEQENDGIVWDIEGRHEDPA